MGRSSTTSHTPADLVPLLCEQCGLPLEGGADSALFMCLSCGSAHEPTEEGLARFPVVTATVTTTLPMPVDIRCLAVWRLPAPDWERVRRSAGSRPAYTYVPAFSLLRPVVQRLGASLCLAQPVLEPIQGLPDWARSGPSGDRDPDEPWSTWDGPGFGVVSPVLVGRQDARALAQFVYLAVESRGGSDLVSTASDLEVGEEELIFIPATWDPRCIHESSWRLLLREFDDLVA